MDTTNKNGAADALSSVPYRDGRRAGLQGSSPSLAPGQPGEPEHENWMQGWRSGNAQRASIALAQQQAAKRALTFHCRYAVGVVCDCGGRGLCLEVA